MIPESKLGIFVHFLFAVTSLLLQTYFVPLIDIDGWRPDFVLILIIVWGYRYGVITAMLAGFVLGIFQDSLSTELIGLSSLANSVTGFIAGQMRAMKIQENTAIMISLLLMILHGIVFYTFYHLRTEFSLIYLVYSRVFPNTIYSFVMLLVVLIFTRKKLIDPTE
jgi:rod shape-determining protein MreD